MENKTRLLDLSRVLWSQKDAQQTSVFLCGSMPKADVSFFISFKHVRARPHQPGSYHIQRSKILVLRSSFSVTSRLLPVFFVFPKAGSGPWGPW